MQDFRFVEKKKQDKRHIVITGAIGSGKSTLLRKLRGKISSKDSIPGLITWNEPGKAVYMRRIEEDESVMIGEYDPQGLSKRNRMRPVPDGFNKYGVSLLDDFINDKSEWVTIDEIGFLEGSCQPYINKLNELFEQKRVIAVVRKQDIKHINDIIQRADAFVIDMDESEYILNIPYKKLEE